MQNTSFMRKLQVIPSCTLPLDHPPVHCTLFQNKVWCKVWIMFISLVIYLGLWVLQRNLQWCKSSHNTYLESSLCSRNTMGRFRGKKWGGETGAPHSLILHFVPFSSLSHFHCSLYKPATQATLNHVLTSFCNGVWVSNLTVL